MASLEEVQQLKTQYMLKLLSEDLICGGQQDAKMRTKVFKVSTQVRIRMERGVTCDSKRKS